MIASARVTCCPFNGCPASDSRRCTRHRSPTVKLSIVLLLQVCSINQIFEFLESGNNKINQETKFCGLDADVKMEKWKSNGRNNGDKGVRLMHVFDWWNFDIVLRWYLNSGHTGLAVLGTRYSICAQITRVIKLEMVNLIKVWSFIFVRCINYLAFFLFLNAAANFLHCFLCPLGLAFQCLIWHSRLQ